MPKDVIFYARSIVSLSGEPISLSGRKKQMKFEFRLLCDIMAKAISVKAGSFNAITVEKFSLITVVVCRIRMNWAMFLFSILKKMVTPGSKQAKGFAIQISLLLATFPTLELGESSEFPASKILSKKTVHRFISINDRDGAEEATGAAKQRAVSKKRPAADVGAAVPKKKRTIKKKSVSSLSTLEMVAVVEEVVPIQQVAEPSAVEEIRYPSADDVDLIIQQVLDEPRAVDVPADKAQPVATEEKLWYDLPYEDLVAKWEAERPVVTASDTDEELATMDVAPADGDQQVIDEVAKFFHSFSLKKLATINFEEMYKKEEQVLYWGETESPQVAIQRKFYILLKYRTVLVWKFLEAWRANFAPGQGSSAVDIQVIELLLDLHLYFLEELAKEARAHGLIWTKPCCSKIFEGSPRDRGAIIARNNTHTPSRCWIRTMLYVNGEWVVEPCADRWVKIPRVVISNEVPRQRQYDDTLPTVSVFFRLMTKRWADVCLEVFEFCASQRLIPAGSLQFCRSLQLVEPVSRIAPSRSPVFAFRVSQFCSIFVDFSLFNWIPSADISEFLSSVALDRTVFRSIQSSQNSFSVAPSVQLSLDQHQSSSSSTDSYSSLRFDQTDVDATTSSLPPASQDLSAALADLHATLSEQIFEYQSDLSSKLHKIEQSVCDSLRDQADIFRNLSQGARQEARTLDDVQTIRFNDFRKHVLAQNASIFTGLADVRQEVQAVNAKVDIMASRLNANQKDAEATKEALSHQLLEFQSSAQENHSVLHAQLSELFDYIHRGGADKKGENDSRGLQQPSNVQVSASAERTPTFAHSWSIREDSTVGMLSVVDLYSERFRRYFLEEQSADVVVSISRYRFEFQRVLLRSTKRQRFDNLNDVVGVHSYLSAVDQEE
ncbi:ICln family transporter: chloride ion current inducer protein I(Cln) [Dorcoceras hygrometricum]|uniref:ICln family transporter: chloride ion current inducer protein I(Cln) n=1 Tax=Dorcoceras hygrometricum TaxID=472368 RepID=A0A2Z7BND3_9LAMI|nr:ICln family transporter: chloride ion current inducer protein I(Cln) [Dorcoceras hygrometricum]